MNLSARNEIGTLCGRVSETSSVCAQNDVQRRATVVRGNSVELPVTENVAEQGAALLEARQGVNRVEDEGVPSVKIGVALVEVVVEHVSRGTNVRLSWDVTDRTRQGVSGLESKPVSKPAVDPDLQCVIIGITCGLIPRHAVGETEPSPFRMRG